MSESIEPNLQHEDDIPKSKESNGSPEVPREYANRFARALLSSAVTLEGIEKLEVANVPSLVGSQDDDPQKATSLYEVYRSSILGRKLIHEFERMLDALTKMSASWDEVLQRGLIPTVMRLEDFYPMSDQLSQSLARLEFLDREYQGALDQFHEAEKQEIDAGQIENLARIYVLKLDEINAFSRDVIMPQLRDYLATAHSLFSSETSERFRITDAEEVESFNQYCEALEPVALLAEAYQSDLVRIEFLIQELQDKRASTAVTRELDDASLQQQLSMRETELYQLSLINPQIMRSSRVQRLIEERNFHHEVVSLLTGKPFSRSTFFEESELIYGALLLAPSLSTKQWFENLRNAYLELPERLTDERASRPDEVDTFEVIDSARNPIKRFTRKMVGLSLQEQFITLLNGETVLELGGTAAANALEKLGARQAVAVDAGHSGYTGISYSAGKEEEMLHLGNYEKYFNPHSVTLACSSRFFDLGSGIEKIAKSDWEQKDPQSLGEAELTLVLANALIDDAFMLHYDGPPAGELPKQLGMKEVYRAYAGMTGVSVMRYRRQDRSPDLRTVRLGLKLAQLDPSKDTFEISN